jgi:hypothetical protein
MVLGPEAFSRQLSPEASALVVGLLVELERVLGGELVVLLDSGSVAVHPTRSSAVMSSSDFLIRTPLSALG